MQTRLLLPVLLAAMTSCVAGPNLRPEGDAWPRPSSNVSRSPAQEARVEAVLDHMTLEDKVGQIIQGDIGNVTPEDVRRYRLGSILNGGSSSPGGNETAPAADWLELADAFWQASMDNARAPNIPVMWGTDAVHGHSNVIGATLFPHNIGLGATRNPALIRRIGEITAKEIAVTGLDWDFSPTLAVVRDDRWGRTYEGFSEDPEIVRSFAAAMVEGLQGRAGTAEFLGPGRVIATAKHFVGDGGTSDGNDRGDNPSSPDVLRDVHGAGYPAAIAAGVQAVMASFSSVRGEKVHGDHDLLTGVLKQQMGFDGLVVGDWNGHGQVTGCTNTSCPRSINAGLDMFMAPDSWRGLYDNTLAQARSGEIAMERLNDAVRRVLRVKVRAGLFDKGKPSTRPFAGQFELLGSAAHRAVARQAVRESLVLLKNAGNLLPLPSHAHVLVAGDGADNIAKQNGGWTLTWQGTGTTNRDFPNAQSIYDGVREAVIAAGGTATLSPTGVYSGKPDVAIVVFGENPYAEYAGDRSSLEFSPGDKEALGIMRRLKADGIPVVAVFLSGRPMWVNPEINAATAFVAAFLPGGEGGGVADVLFREPDGGIRYDFKGKLSYSWPKRADQTALNRGDDDYDPLFAYGFGLSYADNGDLAPLSEERPIGASPPADATIFGRGAFFGGWSFALLQADGGVVPVVGTAGASRGGIVRVSGIDRRAQEDARLLVWSGAGEAEAEIVGSQPMNLARGIDGEHGLLIEYRVDQRPTASVSVAIRCGMDCDAALPITAILNTAPLGQWQTLTLPLGCLRGARVDLRRVTTPLAIRTRGSLALALSDVRIVSITEPAARCSAE